MGKPTMVTAGIWRSCCCMLVYRYRKEPVGVADKDAVKPHPQTTNHGPALETFNSVSLVLRNAVARGVLGINP
jgi:hypothetical protein